MPSLTNADLVGSGLYSDKFLVNSDLLAMVSSAVNIGNIACTVLVDVVVIHSVLEALDPIPDVLFSSNELCTCVEVSRSPEIWTVVGNRRPLLWFLLRTPGNMPEPSLLMSNSPTASMVESNSEKIPEPSAFSSGVNLVVLLESTVIETAALSFLGSL